MHARPESFPDHEDYMHEGDHRAAEGRPPSLEPSRSVDEESEWETTRELLTEALGTLLVDNPTSLTQSIHLGCVEPGVIAQIASRLKTESGMVFITIANVSDTTTGEATQDMRLWTREPQPIYGFAPRNSTTVATCEASSADTVAALETLRQSMQMVEQRDLSGSVDDGSAPLRLFVFKRHSSSVRPSNVR